MAESMSKIEIIIRPSKLDAVKKALSQAGYSGLTVSQAEGHGNQKGLSQKSENGAFRMEMVPKVRMEVVASESDTEKLVQAVCDAAQTGEPGDGKIFITSIRDAIRIRTGERGSKAI